MDFRTVTDTSSRQYQLIQQASINDGLLYIDNHALVALGSYYGEVGSKYKLTFEDGDTLLVIKGDEKSNAHVVDGCYHESNNSMVEFIVDTQTLNANVLQQGNLDVVFNGKIIKIEKEN